MVAIARTWRPHGLEGSSRYGIHIPGEGLPLLAVAVLAPCTAAAGLARLAYLLVTYPTAQSGRFAAAAGAAGLCAMAVAGGWVQWLAAYRLLRAPLPRTAPVQPTSAVEG